MFTPLLVKKRLNKYHLSLTKLLQDKRKVSFILIRTFGFKGGKLEVNKTGGS